jgi:hypothetical protein
MFIKQWGLGARNHQPILPTFGNIIDINNSGGYNEQEIILQQLFGGGQNTFNPIIIGNAMVSDNNNPLGIIAQNWLTAG